MIAITVVAISAVLVAIWAGSRVIHQYHARLNEIYDFAMMLSDMANAYEQRRKANNDGRKYPHRAEYWFASKYRYEDFQLSTKPLQLNKWFSDEEIEEILR